VRLRFRPTDNVFYDMLSASAANLGSGSDLLPEILIAESNKKDLAKKMRAIEHQGDETTHEIIRRVNSTFVTPFDREDIYSLAAGLDDVMDFMEEAVDLVNLYEIDELPARVAQQVEVIQRCAELTCGAMPRLRTMRELEDYWIEINRLENDGDKAYRKILAELFSGQHEALVVLKVKDVVDALEAAIDAFESVANTVEQISVKES
jgi:predicted phosphate transport protein (TIGR00153 family)